MCRNTYPVSILLDLNGFLRGSNALLRECEQNEFYLAALQRVAKPGLQIGLSLGQQVGNSDCSDTSESSSHLVINKLNSMRCDLNHLFSINFST